MTNAKYHVPPLASPDRPRAAAHEGAAKKPAAILIVHGMGQQIPFQTLDVLAEGLQRQNPRANGAPAKPVARTVVVGDERLSRLEVDVALDSRGTTRSVHVYEAYWAPLTEGKITLRDVVRFLFSGGFRGIRWGWQPFKRWLFDSYVEFPAPVRTVLYLAVVLAVVASLAWLNVLIVTLAAARAPFTTPPAWLSGDLFGDVTTVLNVLVAALLAFVLCLAVAMQRPIRWLRRLAGFPSVVLFIVAVWTTLLAACAAAVVVAYHLRRPGQGSVFDVLGAGARVAAFNHLLNLTILVAGAVIGGSIVLYWSWTFLRRLVSSFRQDADSRVLTAAVFAVVLTLFVSVIGFAWWLAQRVLPDDAALRVGRLGISWPLVVLTAALVRSFLVQYVGDVVAYVQSQTLDRFYGLRQQIKDLVWRKAHAVYSLTDYDDILLVGHSLGSVVMYDVLNRLLTDEVRVANAPAIAARTRLLLTFGSPLDKTAFLFGVQGTGSEAREALAASVQPLISDPACRPVWVNVYSPWDVISGSLDYYDLPDASNRRPVENRRDAEATTLFAAHEQYWDSTEIFQQIIKRLH